MTNSIAGTFGETVVGNVVRSPATPHSLPDVDDKLSPRLYNQDLAPTKREGRSWSGYNIFTLWVNDVHSLGNYSFAIGLFALGLGGWQILLSLSIGAVLLFLLLSLSGLMGEKTGIPFPVMSRIAFGIHGAQIAALLRGGVAIVWFGIQTYLASVVLRIMLEALFPGVAAYNQNNILGLSSLGWATFLSLWVVQTVIISYGMELVRKYEAIAGPIVLVTMTSLAIWMFIQVDGNIAPSITNKLVGTEMWLTIFGGGALWVAIYGTFVLNFCDFTRSSKSKQSMLRGNFWGIPINMFLFGVIVILMAGGQFSLNGTIIQSPSDIVQSIPNKFILSIACIALLVLTVAVNLMANFVAPVYALTNLFPRSLNFRRAAIVSAVLGLVILPWHLYNSPIVIVYFLGGLGALLGPLFGIIMADYWLLRKAKVNVPDLYTEASHGSYFYQAGYNPKAIYALIPSSLIALGLALLPSFQFMSSFTWFFGVGIAATIYYCIADKKAVYVDVSGEDIAVENTNAH
ncbi:NCS1 family nucleobase:cation symporter-1 [Aeromonas cavernicola]|uniref:Nitrate reductase n=1 Tax=Aeromonas cavernicola TaxID=1006623 RepID=A0A2H9U579_9GAMM|nr:NCS1 family nucleobase:cation symporter-1 [Aeromonas cavernicola]PJG59177.1 nitrate reductase [Aeromonas cavernicola]